MYMMWWAVLVIGECSAFQNIRYKLTCLGPHQVFKKCASNCPETCEALVSKQKCSPDVNRTCESHCRCVPGYYRDADNKCVPLSKCYCPHKLEEYSTCIDKSCEAVSCLQLAAPRACPDDYVPKCPKGCVCIKGHLRDANGNCIPVDKCEGIMDQMLGQNNDILRMRMSSSTTTSSAFPITSQIQPTPSNRTATEAPNIQTQTYLLTRSTHIEQPDVAKSDFGTDGTIANKPTFRSTADDFVVRYEFFEENLTSSSNKYDEEYIDFGYKVDVNETEGRKNAEKMQPVVRPSALWGSLGSSSDKELQSYVACPGANQVFDKCVSNCPDTCDSLGKGRCRINMNRKCESHCRCMPGYYKNVLGECITQAQCKQCGLNQFYTLCLSECPPQTCESIDIIYECPNYTESQCAGGCMCHSGFYRNEERECITEEECKCEKICGPRTLCTCDKLGCDCACKPGFMAAHLDGEKLLCIRYHTKNNNSTTTLARLTRTTSARPLDLDSLIELVVNITYDYENNLSKRLNDILRTIEEPTDEITTTVEPDIYTLNGSGTVISKCYVCGMDIPGIPHHADCSDGFAGDFLPMMPVDPMAKKRIPLFRKYCRYLPVWNYRENPKDPLSVWGRWTGGCAVRWTDLSGIYTQRVCRNRHRPSTGKHYASKRMAKLELALNELEEGCIISPMATLLPLSRGISLYARFHACVCKGDWCNRTAQSAQWIVWMITLPLITAFVKGIDFS